MSTEQIGQRMSDTSGDVQVDPEVLITTAGEVEYVGYRLGSGAGRVRDTASAFNVDDLQFNGEGDEVLRQAILSCQSSLFKAAGAADTLHLVVTRDSFALAESALGFQEADLKAAEELARTGPGTSHDGGYS